MLPDKVDVSTHSILGTVSDFYQHQALQDADKENDDFTLSLPPIFPRKTDKRKNKNDTDNDNNNDNVEIINSPIIPSIFSPISRQNRHKSNICDLIRGQEIEKEKENRKLQQLLKGDRIYATREERVLKRWSEQQKEWKNMKKNIASKIGKKQSELVITRAEEWREMIEEIDLMTKSIPLSSMSSNHWQHSLRKKTGTEETTHLVPIGNMFSGLYCKVTHNPKKPIKETVRKPRKLISINNSLENDHNIFTHYNEPGKGAASKHWRKRSVTYQFRKKLHKKMTQLKPNNLDELDGLEIVGYNMFNIDKLQLPSYSYERLVKSDNIDIMRNNNKNINDNNSEYLDDESYHVIDHKHVPIIGPNVDFIPSNVILFNSSLHEEQTKVIEIKNTGTTAMLLRFENVEQIFKNNAIFLYPTEQFSILPGHSKLIAFYFKPSKPGSYHLVIGIESFPSISPKIIELEAICLIEDEDKMHRDTFIKQMRNNQIEQDVTNMIYNMIQSIPEPDPKQNNLPHSFCKSNRDHKLYWYPEILNELQLLSETIISKFRRRKRKTYKWDLSVTTLKIWLKELQHIQTESIIQPLYFQLLEYIERAQKIPPPNPLYYDLCSNLINDLILQIPRFSWRANQFAQISYKNEQEEQKNAKQAGTEEEEQEDEKDEESDISSTVEWNVFESEFYQNKLYKDCKEYLYHIIDQFENSIVNENEINETIIKPIKSKLNPEPQRIITFGIWVNDENKSSETTNTGSESIKYAEIEPLYNHCIESIHSNSNITIMTSLYKTWICSNKQSFKTMPQRKSESDPDNNENKDNEDEEDEETATQEFDDDDDEKELSLNDFKLLPILKGFNIIQIFCCNDIINILTDTGDVYCSLFDDLRLYQTEILFNKNIIKITGSAPNNKCVALSETGEIFEWSLISESLAMDTNNEETENNKDENTESDSKEKESSSILKISEPKQLTEIDKKLKDIAITSSAYAAITNDEELIIWGDYNKIYSINSEEQEDKTKKKKNKSKSKSNDEESTQPLSAYIIIEFKEKEETVSLKYKNIVSCLNNFVVLDNNGNLYSFGKSEYGALGLGNEINESLQPKLISFEDKDNNSEIIIKSISSWINGCIAIDNNSNIWYWGKYFDNNSKLETKISESTENESDQEKKEEEERIYYIPSKIKIESEFNPIKKAIVTDIGAFLWL